jgi:hypothetical protein
MITFCAFSAARVDDLWMYALVGMAGGLFLFYRGFRMLQRKRLILNTPTSKIRSASLGLVEISGLADGPYTIPAPITGRSCYYYRTQAWELRKSGKSEEWKQVADESLHVPFYVDDNTGKLLVNPQGADLDLHRDFHQEYRNSIMFGKEMPDPVRRFLARHGVSGEHKVRVDEYCIKPKNALFILGTLAENTGTEVAPNPIRTEPNNTVRFNISLPGGSTTLSASLQAPSTDSGFRTVTHHEVIRLSPEKKAVASADLTQQGKIAAALVKAGVTAPAAWAAAGIKDPASAMAASDANSSAAATATAPELSTLDLHPKVVLMKGENDPTFLISWRSQRDVVSSLGWKSTACIWGGPALVLLSVYVLLLRMGWL